VRRIDHAQLLRELAQQGVSNSRFWAFRCPVCGTIQSAASLMAAGMSREDVRTSLAVECEGRLLQRGAWPLPSDRSSGAVARRKLRGCNWTLNGFVQLHELEVFKDGVINSLFELAKPEEAQALEAAYRPLPPAAEMAGAA
jgi:hypothetical protein